MHKGILFRAFVALRALHIELCSLDHKFPDLNNVTYNKLWNVVVEDTLKIKWKPNNFNKSCCQLIIFWILA